jgi:hypothetical protein
MPTTIDNYFLYLRKLMVGLVMLVFAFVITYVPQQYNQHKNVEQVDALFGLSIVLDPSNLVKNTLTAITAIATKLKDFTLDGIAWAIAKHMISSMLNSLLVWINSGFRGSPAFVQDFGKFLLQSADEAVGQYILSVHPSSSISRLRLS